MARKGDLIVVNPRRVGGPPREGEIIEVREGELRVQYRVRWKDGHETYFAPAAGSARIEPAQAIRRASSPVTVPKKSPGKTSPKTTAKKASAKKTTAKRSTAKATMKSAAKKSR